MVLFGGMAPKNTEVNMGGIGRHEARDWLVHVRQAGAAFVNIRPMRSDAAEALGAEWLPLRPNTDVVRIYNDRGSCLAGAVVTDAIRPRVVQLSTGAWFDPLDSAEVGSLDKHGNPNVLTLDKGTSKLAQCCIAQTALVEVECFDGEVPEITVFAPPRSVQS
jgi:anaerobic selenocysteine-containing dehydrogenase